jgi:hypothetical protein
MIVKSVLSKKYVIPNLSFEWICSILHNLNGRFVHDPVNLAKC